MSKAKFVSVRIRIAESPKELDKLRNGSAIQGADLDVLVKYDGLWNDVALGESFESYELEFPVHVLHEAGPRTDD